jgi:type IV pilus assembly protein PilP
MSHSRFVTAWVSASLLLALGGCSSSSNEELQQWMVQQRNTVKPKVDPVAEPKRFVPQAFTAESAVSPFSADKFNNALRNESGKATNSALIAPELQRRKEPLEAMPLDDMKMVGILNKGGKMVALVRVNNLLYQVRPGNYLGQNYGRITRITETEITLREIAQDAAGEWIERPATLQLQEGTSK